MKYLKEIITTIISFVIFVIYAVLRSSDIELEELDFIIIGSFFGAVPFLLVYGWASRIRKWPGKPKLEFRPTIEEDSFKHEKGDKEESKRITFWIHIRNLGNNTAENCKIRLKITTLYYYFI